jgi:hypothetical protein
MQFSLFKKRTVKEAWVAIAAARIDSDHARKTTLQALRKEWENLAFTPGEDVDYFTLCLNTLQQKMVQFDDDTYGGERAVEKLFRCIPEKYKQIARSIESLLDLSTMLIEEAIGRLKVVDGDEPQPLSGPITVGRKLHLTQEQWEACQGDGKKGESPPSTGGRKRGTSRAEAPKPWRKDVPGVALRRRPQRHRRQPEAGTRRHLPQLWQAWPLGQEVSIATTRSGPRRTGGGGASSASGTCKHRVIFSGIGRSGSPPS